jgi:hypothetical protein
MHRVFCNRVRHAPKRQACQTSQFVADHFVCEIRSWSSFNDVRSVDSASGSMGKIAAGV